MSEHRVFISAIDTAAKIVPSVSTDISLDGGMSWRSLTPTEKQAGVRIGLNQKLTLRAKASGLWDVEQKLCLSHDAPSGLSCDGERDFGTLALSSAPTGERAAQEVHHTLNACLSLFRDATPDRAAQGNNEPPPYMYSLLAFDGPNVLNSDGSGLGRLAATPAINVLSYGTNVGELFYLKTPDGSKKPRQSVVFVPNGLDLSEPVPVHVFFSPSTGGKKLPYPYSDGDNSFNAMIHNYLISGGKRFLSQHVASGKSCVFVFPLPAPKTYFSDLQSAHAARNFCLEVVYYLQRVRGVSSLKAARLGRCALSGFSEGGRPIAQVIASSPRGEGFPELQELYLLDVMPPSGSSADVGSYHRLMSLLDAWWANGKGRRKLRFYSQYYSFGSNLAIRGKLTQRNAGAREYQSPDATCVHTPESFWKKVAEEQLRQQPDLGYDFSRFHQLMPCVFLQHALRNSEFPSR